MANTKADGKSCLIKMLGAWIAYEIVQQVVAQMSLHCYELAIGIIFKKLDSMK